MLHLRFNMPLILMMLYGSILIFIVLIFRSLFRNKLPKFVFPLLWGAILLRLLIPFSLSSPLSLKIPILAVPQFSLMEAELNAVSEDTPADLVVGTSYDQNVEKNAISEDTPIDLVVETSYGKNSEKIAVAYDTNAVETISEIGVSYSPSRLLYTLLPFIYIAGIFITASALFLQKYRCQKRLRNALFVENNETINTFLRELGMGHILVFTNDETASPLVCGLMNPKIYLPTRMCFDNTQLLQHILCHETMHIRHKDNYIKFVMLIALCLNWFNPLVWIMAKCLSADLEAACDEAVLRFYHDEEAKKQYAMSLLTMAISQNRSSLLYSAFSKTEVEKRIQNILQYKKASFLVLALSVCLVLSGSIASATAGQAPFENYLTAFCGSASCRWGVKVNLTRDIALGKNAGKRAETIIFDAMRADTTNDPEILEKQIKNALSNEFRVEKSAFTLDIILNLDQETLFEEYASWGLAQEKEKNRLLYNGEPVRTYSDKMLGRYQSQPEGTVDIAVVRDRLGFITNISAFHKGDMEFDRRTNTLNTWNVSTTTDVLLKEGSQ